MQGSRNSRLSRNHSSRLNIGYHLLLHGEASSNSFVVKRKSFLGMNGFDRKSAEMNELGARIYFFPGYLNFGVVGVESAISVRWRRWRVCGIRLLVMRGRNRS